MIPRRWAAVPVLALALASVAARASEDVAPPNRVEIKAFGFHPAELRVKPGATVTWVNRDQEPHTVTGETGDLRSPALDTDDSYAYAFARPGLYRYYCRLHPQMTGTVQVE